MSKTESQGQPEMQKPVASSELFGEKVLRKLTTLTHDERAHAYVQANSFKWPDALAELKPDQWDEMTDQQKRQSPEGKTMWNCVKMVTSEYDRSKAWWIEALGRTSKDHDEWWLLQFSPND